MKTEATGSTVRTTAEIARTDRFATLQMDTVLTAANCGTHKMFAKQKYVSKIYKQNTLLIVDGGLQKGTIYMYCNKAVAV